MNSFVCPGESYVLYVKLNLGPIWVVEMNKVVRAGGAFEPMQVKGLSVGRKNELMEDLLYKCRPCLQV